MHLTIVGGTRPNFIKISPIIQAIEKARSLGNNISFRLIHTGQHYDRRMSDTFFEELAIPEPDINLGCGGGTQAEQTAAIMIAFEKELLANPTDYVLVVGDVTSTMACTIVAKKLNNLVIHVEAGIRSFDMTMPEEINRLVTDALTDLFFTTSSYANENLVKAGVDMDRIHFVGNVMIDSLKANIDRLKEPDVVKEFGLQQRNFFVLTMHRPSNVDDPVNFERLLQAITENASDKIILFPIHPRTKKIFESLGKSYQNLILLEPLGYLEFNWLVKNSMAVITDSGGITEETTALGIPCLTLRDNTERPETCIVGTNKLIGTSNQRIAEAIKKVLAGKWKKGSIPELWDGKTAERIVNILLEKYAH